MKSNKFKKVIVGTTLSVAMSFGAISTDIPYNVFSDNLMDIAFASEHKKILDLKFENDTIDNSASAVETKVFGNPEFVPGRIGQAIQFQEAGQYLDLGNSNEIQFGESTDFSVSFWIKSDGIKGDPAIISNKDWNSGSNTGWFLGVNGSGNLIWNYKTSGSSRLDYQLPKVVDNYWHHIVVSHDRSGGIARFFKDGKLIKSIDISKMKGTLDSKFTTKIGQDGTGKYGSTLTAQIDELQVYQNALTDQDVSDMYNSAPTLPPVLVESITIDQPELNLKAGVRMPLTASILPMDATNKEVEWSSSDDTVAKIEIINNRPTVITGRTGEAIITAKTRVDGIVATSKVHVSHSLDVSGDGLLTEADLKIIQENKNIREGDAGWEKGQIADINDDKQVNTLDVKMMEDKLAPYKKDFPYKRVVFIGIDGAGNAVKAPQANAVNIQKLISEGAGTYEAKAQLPTISAQNWGAMFHGVVPEKHQLTNDITANTPYAESSLYPSYMKLLTHERPMIQQASFATWSSINIGIIEDSAGAYKVNGGNDNNTTQKAVDYIKKEGQNSRNIFVHLDEVDGAGHNSGYYSPKFYEQLQKADEHVGRIVQAVEEEGLMKDTLFIITSDHGGNGTGHGGSTVAEQTVFWASKGESIKPGTVISNVTSMDTAAVIAKALRLDIPENWDAKIPTGLFQEYIGEDNGNGSGGSGNGGSGSGEGSITPTPPSVVPAPPILDNSIITTDATKITGKAEKGSTVVIQIDGKTYSGKVDESGHFTIEIPKQTTGTVLTITVKNAAGLVSKEIKVTIKGVTLPIAPSLSSNSITDQQTSISGNAEPGKNVKMDNGSKIWSAIVDEKGIFKINFPKQAGDTIIQFYTVDVNGNKSTSIELKVKDVTPPAKPTIKTVADNQTSIKGKGEKGAIASLLINNNSMGTTKIDANGNYSFKVKKLSAGTTIKVKLKDKAGNESGYKLLKVLDRTPPARPTVSKINEKSTKISGKSEAYSKVQVYLNNKLYKTVTASKKGTFTAPLKKVKVGSKLKFIATDKAGNRSKVNYLTVTKK